MRKLVILSLSASSLLLAACAPSHALLPPQPTCCVNPDRDPLHVQDGPLAQRSVHFSLDSVVIPAQFQPMLEAHGRYLQAHPARRVLLIGNTDTRGTRDYSLSLGERYARAVAHALKQHGASDTQLEIVSYGKERPKASGKDEASQAQNRRVDIEYLPD